MSAKARLAREGMSFWSRSCLLDVQPPQWSRGNLDGQTDSPRIMTEVVPSPTSSSCALESSIMLLAAGWLTSTSRRMQCPSFVITMPPMGSRSILSMERGPSVVRMMPATAWGGSQQGLYKQSCMAETNNNVARAPFPPMPQGGAGKYRFKPTLAAAMLPS